MITRGEDVEASALQQRGWTIAAIARHLGRDRKTVRAHLRGDRAAGVRQRSGAGQLAPFVAYLQARFADNAHIWATALYDEVVPLGYPGSYPSFARQLRQAALRPHCEACAGVKGGSTSRSPIHRGTRSSGIGSTGGPRGAGWPTSCWAPCRARGECGGCWRSSSTKPI